MRRITLLLIIILSLSTVAGLSAYDQIWGARLDLNVDLPEFLGSTVAVTMEDTANAWYRGSWGPKANIEVDGGAGFDFDFTFGLTNEQAFAWHGLAYSIFPELDKLNFYGNAGILGYKAGRQLVRDPAGLIIDAPMDGVDLSLDLGGNIITAGFGYTGLTFLQSSEFFMTNADLSDDILSVNRMMEYLAWNMPVAARWLNLSAYFLAVQDLSSPEDQTGSLTDAYHPLFLEVMARGFLGSSFLYDLSLVGQYGSYGSTSVLAGIGRLGFSWLPGGPSRLGVDLMASSGDSWSDRDQYLLGMPSGSNLNQYLPVSIVSTQGYVIEFEVGNLASLGLFYANKPRESHSWEIRTTTLLRTAEGPVSSSLVSDGVGDGSFLGQELLFSWFWRPRSDFGWDLKLGLMYVGETIQMDSFLQEYYLDTVPVMMRLGFDWSWSF